MNAFVQIALGWQCLMVALRQMGRAGLWVPWLLLAALQVTMLIVIAGFAHPAVSAWMAPLLVRAAGSDVLHYPAVFDALPALQARGEFLIGLVPGIVLVGAATAQFGARYEGHAIAARAGLAQGVRRGGALLVAQLPFQILVLALTFVLEWWLTTRGSAGLTRKLAGLVGQWAAILLAVPFLFVPPLVMLGRHGAAGAWRELPEFMGRGGLAALALVLLGAAVRWPFAMLAVYGGRLVKPIAPELTLTLAVGQVLAAMVSGFLVAGAAALLYQTLESDRREGW
jgi:hypothetical protein